eukprot:5906485-Amphidinium_carterae.1
MESIGIEQMRSYQSSKTPRNHGNAKLKYFQLATLHSSSTLRIFQARWAFQVTEPWCKDGEYYSLKLPAELANAGLESTVTAKNDPVNAIAVAFKPAASAIQTVPDVTVDMHHP